MLRYIRLRYIRLRYVTLHYIILIKKCKRYLAIFGRCQLCIKVPFKLQPEDGFKRAETCGCYVLLIKYIVYNKAVIDYKLVRFINY
jgi:hypothetical protein